MRALLAVIAVIAVFAALGATSLDAGAEPASAAYEVTRLRGTALAWAPRSTDWRALRLGDVVAEGTLVQLAKGSRVALEGRSFTPGDEAPRGIFVDGDEPVIVRVGESLVRKVEFGGYYLSVPELTKVFAKQEKDDGAFMRMREAFERMASIFNTEPTPPDERPVAQSDIETGGSGEPGQDVAAAPPHELALLHPREGDNYLVSELPTVVAVQWQDPPDGTRRFVVTLQHLERGGKKRTAATTETFHRFELTDAGRYRVSVESEDGRWRAAPHQFSVATLGE